MSKESRAKSNAKSNAKPAAKSNKNNSNSYKKKRLESSDSDACSSSDDDDSDYDPNDKLDMAEYRKMLSTMFPSKHLNNKIAADNRLKRTLLKDSKRTSPTKRDSKSDRVSNKHTNKKNRVQSSSEEEEEEEDDSDSDYEEEESVSDSDYEDEETEDSEDDEEESGSSSSEEDEGIIKRNKSNKNFNIIFTIGKDSENEYDSDWETDDDEDEEEETDEDEDVDVSESESESEEPAPSRRKQKDDKLSPKGRNDAQNVVISRGARENNEQVTTTGGDVNNNTLKQNEEILKSLKEITKNYGDNKITTDFVKTFEAIIEKTKQKQTRQIEKQKAKNLRIFKKQLREKNNSNDNAFFNKFELDYQKKIIKELREINQLIQVEKPYRLTLIESSMPNIFKAAAMKRINTLKHMEPSSGEFYKIKNWVDTFMKIPFGKFETLPVNISNGVDSCHEFMDNALKRLDTAVYGLNDAKMQIMQMLGQLITNPAAIGTSIAIKGAMGTGKTSLVKEGISKILNRPFAFIALGGATDSTFLEGHSYTYEGSTWGKIVQILIDSKCMNPVIYFDELDKISDTPKGEEIAGILTHLTDSTQNSQFHDKYFSDVDFDLSKCLFIFSYNDESKINPILRDRMYKIQTKGYDKKQKTIIANQYLLPGIREQVKFNDSDITIQEDALHYIIDSHCNKEEGVRNLKRCLEIIHTKLNLYRLMKSDTNLFEQEISLKVEFPFVVTKSIVDKLIKPTSENNEVWKTLYN
jgi:ATP-dependent Lon protease